MEATDENDKSLLHPHGAGIDENNEMLSNTTTILIQEREVMEDGNNRKEEEICCNDRSVTSSVSKTSNFSFLPKSESDDDDSSRFSFAAVSSSSMYWGAATTNNNMHTIASTLSKSLIQITSNNVNAVPNARGDNTVYSRGAVIAVENGDDMENLIELFETNNNKPNEEGNNDTPKSGVFRNIVNAIETGDETKLKAIQELCPQWKENVEYVLRKTDLVDVSHALTEVKKDLELTNKQLYVLDFFQFSLQEAFNHLQQKYSCINRYSK
jgi:hypothetical protein